MKVLMIVNTMEPVHHPQLLWSKHFYVKYYPATLGYICFEGALCSPRNTIKKIVKEYIKGNKGNCQIIELLIHITC